MKGDVRINGVDAFEQYGINLEDGALSALMAPIPLKEFVENDVRTKHGKEVYTSLSRYASREITLPFHLIAKSKEEFFIKYQKFCDEVLANGKFELTTKYQPDVVYRLVYNSCTQFRQFIRELAVFSLKVTEPDPTDRAIVL